MQESKATMRNHTQDEMNEQKEDTLDLSKHEKHHCEESTQQETQKQGLCSHSVSRDGWWKNEHNKSHGGLKTMLAAI